MFILNALSDETDQPLPTPGQSGSQEAEVAVTPPSSALSEVCKRKPNPIMDRAVQHSKELAAIIKSMYAIALIINQIMLYF